MVLEPFRVAFAVDDDAQRATDKVIADLAAKGSGGSVGFVYITDRLKGNLTLVIERLKQVTGIETWIGTMGLGVIGGCEAAFDKPAIAAMIATWPRNQIKLYDEVPVEAFAPSGPNAFGLPKAIVHVDPRNQRFEELLQELARVSGAYLLGGLTASRTRRFDQVAGKITEGGISGLLLGPEIDVAIGVAQGCTPIGPSRIVTGVKDQLLTEIGGEVPLKALLADLSATDESDLRRMLQSLHVGLPVAHSDTGDYVVRNIVGIDTDKGAIAIADRVEPGQKIFFCQRDRAAATKDLETMVQKLKSRTQSVNGALYVSCCGRGPSIFASAEEEIGLVQKGLGDVPLIGFYANGEIAGDRVYGYTGVLALF